MGGNQSRGTWEKGGCINLIDLKSSPSDNLIISLFVTSNRRKLLLKLQPPPKVSRSMKLPKLMERPLPLVLKRRS